MYNGKSSFLLQEYEKGLNPIDTEKQSSKLEKIEKNVNKFLKKDPKMKRYFNWARARDFAWRNSFIKDG